METPNQSKIKKLSPFVRLYIFIGWPLAGVLGLIYVLLNFKAVLATNGSALTSLLIIILLFATTYGLWAVKRAWKEIN